MKVIRGHRTKPSFSLQELDQVEAALLACDKLSTTLRARHLLLIEELDRLTAPPCGRPVIRPKVIGRGYDYQGAYFPCNSSIDIYSKLLKQLWDDFPGHRETMAVAIAGRGNSRKYVARSPNELFTNRQHDWIARYSRLLVDDWYLDTNLNDKQKLHILVSATKAVGLRWDCNIKVRWRPQLVGHLA